MKQVLIGVFILIAWALKSQDTVKVALNLNPEQQAELDYNNGISALKKMDFNSASELFTKCISVKSGFDKAYANRAIAYINLKKHNQALGDINYAIFINPQNPDFYYDKSLVYFALSLRDSQNITLDKCLAINANHAYTIHFF